MYISLILTPDISIINTYYFQFFSSIIAYSNSIMCTIPLIVENN